MANSDTRPSDPGTVGSGTNDRVPKSAGTNTRLTERYLEFDKVSWSDTPTFHNTLAVGSSPTSSTAHSRATPELSTFVEMPINSGTLRDSSAGVRNGVQAGTGGGESDSDGRKK